MGKQRAVRSRNAGREHITADPTDKSFTYLSGFLHNVVMGLKPSNIETESDGMTVADVLHYKMDKATAGLLAQDTSTLIPSNIERVRITIVGGNDDGYRPFLAAQINLIDTPGKPVKKLDGILRMNSIGPNKGPVDDVLAIYRRSIEFRLRYRWLFEALLDCEKAREKVSAVIRATLRHESFRMNDIEYREAVGHILYCTQESCQKYKATFHKTLERNYWILTNNVRPDIFW
ncbi:hypothetical protein M1432_01990 [Patescibacteria group bacterium]|nr:hypothetical protein [Patescibacteria group bacterium]